MRRTLLFGTLAFTTACLGNHYRIPKQDLVQLAQTDPQQRGERVRIIQGFGYDEGPPPAPRVGGSTVVVVHGGARVGGPRARRGPGFRPSKLAKAKKDDAKVWIAIAAIAAVAAATTEGMRYDGWAKLHPMHPVHLYDPWGNYTWVPLAQLTPELAMSSRKAWVRSREGPFIPLGRAPLNRVGWTYSLTMGAGEFVSVRDEQHAGFMSHIQFGFFPVQHVGILLDFGLGWAQNQVDETVFEDRNALEIQILPVSAGRIHGGAFGQLGAGYRLEDGATGSDKSGFFFGGGAMLQLELTTRLAITGRAGMTRIYGANSTDVTLGVSIY
jgi:hypothetical protein